MLVGVLYTANNSWTTTLVFLFVLAILWPWPVRSQPVMSTSMTSSKRTTLEIS